MSNVWPNRSGSGMPTISPPGAVNASNSRNTTVAIELNASVAMAK